MSASTTGNSKRMKGESRQNRTWSPIEDAKLVECLLDLVNSGHWKGDKDIFRSGYVGQLEKLEEKLPDCGLKASPHIESRVKLLKRQYNAIQKMLESQAPGFGWNDKDKCITCEESVFNDWIKVTGILIKY
ncbi:hypothetical protein COCNU_14G008860 [Cocos nucifera]|uniref:Myb/SANT-like domain-containing protein n=1 Tax=Cocos nucifera TaxID=13894 RepID=A0A8K0IW64_COCNU|nr:hypothetical protein COCNU_14G008860 [Cocos nucifera]